MAGAHTCCALESPEHVQVVEAPVHVRVLCWVPQFPQVSLQVDHSPHVAQEQVCASATITTQKSVAIARKIGFMLVFDRIMLMVTLVRCLINLFPAFAASNYFCKRINVDHNIWMSNVNRMTIWESSDIKHDIMGDIKSVILRRKLYYRENSQGNRRNPNFINV